VTRTEPVVDGDHARVVDAYPAVRRFAFVVADRDIDPDDLVHEALARMLSRGGLDRIDDVGAYLRRAVVNLAANERRSLGRRRRAVDRLKAGRDLAESRMTELPSDLADLMHLGPTDRAALFLFVVEGRPHREVAELLDLSENAVRTRVSRALRRLRVELKEEDDRGDA
jgi:RNA polymerase sigma-70 factor (ECF subfamily)